MQQLPPCSIPPPAGVRMRRPAVGIGTRTTPSAFVASDRAAAMTGTVANLTGGE
jgi:hypothetical protein